MTTPAARMVQHELAARNVQVVDSITNAVEALRPATGQPPAAPPSA